MRGKEVVLEKVSAKFDDFTAVHPTDLVVNAGEFFSILGPSGCGKTTMLRMISGFLSPAGGSIRIGDDTMLGVRPNQRPTALIFQNLALFPYMTVWENIAFGLEARGVNKAGRRKRALELIELVALSGEEMKKPDELSGGQRQRVAVARALAVEPSVLLLDEPLAALDLKLRQHMRAELRHIQRMTRVTFIYITHDQGEALTMSDRVAVMNHGRMEQVDTADRIYDHPSTPFVASFVGENNILKGRVTAIENGIATLESEFGILRGRTTPELAVGVDAMLFVRPEALKIGDESQSDNRVAVKPVRRDMEGAFVNWVLSTGERSLVAHMTKAADAKIDHNRSMHVGFAANDTIVMASGEIADTGGRVHEVAV
ncbi:MAG TPA: ABC transporter ATP-binding protein [Acidobacteria bacterium]|nr:ABC transporter ATP-binding protein [Acidobacteriota bacterium]